MTLQWRKSPGLPPAHATIVTEARLSNVLQANQLQLYRLEGWKVGELKVGTLWNAMRRVTLTQRPLHSVALVSVPSSCDVIVAEDSVCNATAASEKATLIKYVLVRSRNAVPLLLSDPILAYQSLRVAPARQPKHQLQQISRPCQRSCHLARGLVTRNCTMMSPFDIPSFGSLTVTRNRRLIKINGRDKRSQVLANEEVHRTESFTVQHSGYNANRGMNEPFELLRRPNHLNRGRSKQSHAAMSFPSGEKTGHNDKKRNVKHTAQARERTLPTERNTRGMKSDARIRRRIEEKATKPNDDAGLKKISFSGGTSQRNQRAPKDLSTKPVLLTKRAEASRNEKKTSLGMTTADTRRQSKLSPLTMRRTERDVSFRQMPKGNSHDESNEIGRHRSASEPPAPLCYRAQLPPTPTELRKAKQQQDMTTVADPGMTRLPKITIDDIFQSWNVTPARVRSGTLGSSDPMDHIRRDWALTHPVTDEPTSYGKMKNCRYLRLPKYDEAGLQHHGCSCNSCEHLEGLKKSPFMNG